MKYLIFILFLIFSKTSFSKELEIGHCYADRLSGFMFIVVDKNINGLIVETIATDTLVIKNNELYIQDILEIDCKDYIFKGIKK